MAYTVVKNKSFLKNYIDKILIGPCQVEFVFFV